MMVAAGAAWTAAATGAAWTTGAACTMGATGAACTTGAGAGTTTSVSTFSHSCLGIFLTTFSQATDCLRWQEVMGTVLETVFGVLVQTSLVISRQSDLMLTWLVATAAGATATAGAAWMAAGATATAGAA